MPITAQQRGKDESLRKVLDKMFAHIDKNKVPTGLLRDYAEEYEDLDIFTGIVPLTEHNAADYVRFAYLLSTIKSADLIGVVSKDIDVFSRQNKSYDENNSISLSLALYKYSQIKENALKDGLITYKNDQVYTTNKDPYKQGYLFACSSLVENTTESSIIISLPQSNLLTNIHLSKLEVNIGNGFQEIGVNKKVKANLQQGRNEIIIKATLDNGQSLLSHMFITKLERKPDGLTRASEYSFPLNPLSNTIVIDGDDYRGISTKAEVSWSLAGSHKTIEKPFIIVEGFDPRIPKTSKGFWSFDSVIAKNPFFEKLRNVYGYDLVYVDWKNSGEYIQANAYTLISVIKWINEQKAIADSKEKNTILGHSMGGVIIRYALKTMENRNVKHQTQTYISYDAPHLGANIPLGVLYGYKAIRDWCADKEFLKSMIKKFSGNEFNVDELLQLGNSLAYSNATAQLLVDYVNPEGNIDNREYILWQKELTKLGFPKGDDGYGLKMLAVANGSYKASTIPDHYLTANANAGIGLLDLVIPLNSLNPFVYGLSLNDITAALVSLIPGKTKVDAEIRISPAKKAGDEITYFKIKIKKKFLWIGPTISHTNFSFDRYYPNIPLYDTYPSSKFDTKKLAGNLEGNIGDSLKIPKILLQREIYVRPNAIPFVPTSSALAIGSGLVHNPDLYTSEPQNVASAFGKNYFVHRESEDHAFFSYDKDVQSWILSRLSTSIVGPINGYSNAQYTLSNASGTVSWKTSNPEIASISSNGILTVKGNGICFIEASNNGIKYSMPIVLGRPRYIIKGTYRPGGYFIKAECLDDEFKNLQDLVNNAFKFKWGIKYGNAPTEWIENTTPEILFTQTSDNEHCICFLEILNNQGERVSIQNMEISSQDIYNVENSTFYIDRNGVLYDGLKNKYDFEYASIYFSRKNNLSKNFDDSSWGAVTALSVDPSGKYNEVAIDDESIPLKEMFTKEAIDYMRLHSEEEQKYIYTIILLNYENKSLQYIPIKIVYKNDINK